MTAGKIHDLTNLGFGNLVTEHTDDGHTFLVHGQHNLECLRMSHAKETLQYVDHKLHRSVVVIEQQDLVARRALGLGLGLGQDAGFGFVIRVVRHHQGHHLLGHVRNFALVQGARNCGHGNCFYAYIASGRVWKRESEQDLSQGRLTTIAFDADDTLWHNERFFRLTQDRFADLLVDYADPDHLAERLLAAEKRNIGHYGYGIKGFTLSMIETAIEVTEDRVPAHVIRELIDAGQEMLRHPIELLPHARAAVESVASTHRVLLITKGDLLDQERKLAQSGLGELFDGVEIVSEKTTQVYAQIFAQHGDGPEQSMMIGNSMRSDVVPAVEAGGWGVFVPHGLVWEIEHAEAPTGSERFFEVADLGGLPDLIARIDG